MDRRRGLLPVVNGGLGTKYKRRDTCFLPRGRLVVALKQACQMGCDTIIRVNNALKAGSEGLDSI